MPIDRSTWYSSQPWYVKLWRRIRFQVSVPFLALYDWNRAARDASFDLQDDGWFTLRDHIRGRNTLAKMQMRMFHAWVDVKASKRPRAPYRKMRWYEATLVVLGVIGGLSAAYCLLGKVFGL